MENQLTTDLSNIIVQTGVVEFKDFERLRDEATELAEQIGKVEVNEENIKVSKKMLAAVNKRVKEMEDKRISIKREMLKPYEEFEKQVKEIVSIVKDAENIVRDQIKEMDEQERQQKLYAIQEMFNKRIRQYSFIEMFVFEDFLKQSHLNKSTSMTTIESEMVEWMETIEEGLAVINGLQHRDEILVEFEHTMNLAKAIKTVEERHERKKELAARQKKQVKNNTFKIVVNDEKDLALLEMFMESKNIKYTVEKVEN